MKCLNMNGLNRLRGLSLVLLTAATPVLAHVGEHVHEHDETGAVVESTFSAFQSGVLHPVTGLDHLLMLLGTGLLAAVALRTLKLPMAALGAMFLGAVGGRYLGEFSAMEMVIVASLVLAGMALLLPKPYRRLTWLMPVMALAHGWAHGVEASPTAFWPFTLGFVLSSAVLLMAGYRMGIVLRAHERVRQVAGGGLIAFAASLLAA
ncbi:MAG: HupE/UreJ family protein [Lautropia sp.]|nr:HupE/UreJ family protein [Lautropia sp.]